MTIRMLTEEDRTTAKALWQSVFDDPPGFVDWFFENRYCPEWSVGVFDGPILISMIHGMPMDLSLGCGSFPAVMTSGIATVPEERGKGHMYDAMRFLQACAAERGVRALFNHPEHEGTYTHLGFCPSSFTKYWEGEGETCPGVIRPFHEDEAFRVYTAMSDRYTGFVRRDREAFHQKIADYGSDDARGFLLEEAGMTVGYCVYFEKEEVFGEEVLSLTSYSPLLHELKRIAGNKGVSAKLPPDADMPGQILPQNVMLASEDIWQAIENAGRPWFCVDEY